MLCRQALALIDYDNVVPSLPTYGSKGLHVNQTIINEQLQELVDAIFGYVKNVCDGIDELDIWLYGGWVDSHNQLTQRARMLMSAIARRRSSGRRNGVTVRPQLRKAIAVRPAFELIGTFRQTSDAKQKMVDSMIVVDVIHRARERELAMFIVSDDDDLVPAALAATSISKPRATIAWLRQRPLGTALNDVHLKRCDMAIDTLFPKSEEGTK